MNLWSWLRGEPSAPEAQRVEPAIVASVAAPQTKQPGDIVGSLNSMAFPQPLLYAALGGYASNTGVPVTPFTALQSAAVYGCTKCISEDIAGLPLQIRRRTTNGGWVIDERHPLNLLFRKPNRWMSAWQFWSYALTAYCLRGNSYIVINRDVTGAPAELIPVTPDRVTVKLSAVDGMPWYLVNARQIGIGVWVPPEDMIHMRNMSVDGYLGLSPIACGQDVLGLALAAQQHGAVLFRQGGQIAGVLKHPGRLSKEASDNLAESWRDTHSGAQNAFKTAVLEEGMTFDKIAITNEDAQFLQCLAPGTLITMENGARAPIEQVRSGHRVMAWEEGQPKICKVVSVGQPPAKPMVRITTNRGRTLTCTVDHPCLGLPTLRTRGGRPVKDEPKWFRAGDLQTGFYLRVALGHTAKDQHELSTEDAYFIGYMVGNGYARTGSCSISIDDEAVSDVVSRIVADMGGSLRPRDRFWDFEIHTGGRGRRGSTIRSLLNDAGLIDFHSHTQRVAANVLRDGPTSWAWFLSGYLDADGTVSHAAAKQPIVSWSSVSRELLDDCQHMLALLGVQSGLYPMAPESSKLMPNGRVTDCRALWCLCVTGRRMLSHLANLLHPYHSTKALRLSSFADLAASRYRLANWHYDRVKSVEPLDVGESYGIEIEGVHTHVTNGLVTHNTRQFQVLDICRMYRVPPHKLAEYGRATFNNVEQQQQMYIDDCLGPCTEQLEGLMNDQLLFDDEKSTYETHFDYTGLLRGDTIRRYQSYQIGLSQGFLNRNEVRAAENMNPIPGGDEYQITAQPGQAEGTNVPKPRVPSAGEGEDEGESEE